MKSGEGDWPAGLHTHLAGPTEGGGWIVVEVWESQEDQDAFMQSRLGPALRQAGVTGRAEARGVEQAPRAPHPEEGLREGASSPPPTGPRPAPRAAVRPRGGPMLRSRLARRVRARTTITVRTGEWR